MLHNFFLTFFLSQTFINRNPSRWRHNLMILYVFSEFEDSVARESKINTNYSLISERLLSHRTQSKKFIDDSLRGFTEIAWVANYQTILLYRWNNCEYKFINVMFCVSAEKIFVTHFWYAKNNGNALTLVMIIEWHTNIKCN